MRIVFDGTTLRPQQTGIGYYTEHLLHHLALETTQQDQLLVVSNSSIQTSLPLPPGVGAPQGYRFPIRSLWMQLVAPLLLSRLNPDVVHFTNSVSPLVKMRPFVLTLHDMSLTLMPQFHPRLRVATLPLIRLCSQRADAIITVSQSARRDILRLARIPENRVQVIPLAAAPAFRPLQDEAYLEGVRRRYGLSKRFILFVGTLEPRKNLPLLIRAYGQLHGEGLLPHQLVCVGLPGWGYREVLSMIEKLQLEKSVRLTGYVPFEDLPALYNLAEFFAFPSLHEGFGLPAMEAMSCGTPVITAANSSLEEIAGGAAEMIDPGQTDSMIQALRNLASDPERRRELSQLGLERAALFSWARAAHETLAVYRRVAGPSRHDP